MVRVKLVVAALGAFLAVSTLGCQEAQLKKQIQQLDLEKTQLNRALSDKEAQLAQARADNTALGQERDTLRTELEREKARKPIPSGPIEGGEDHPVAGGHGEGAAAPGWLRTSVGDRMTLGGHLLFATGSATLTAEGKNALSKVASDLKTHYAGRTIRVYGFTDNSPIVKTKNLWEDNLDLSANRAMAVVRYLWTHGVSKEKIETVAMGDTHPLASNGSAEGKKKNRRVEIFVIRH